MLPDRTVRELKKVYGALCSCGCLPYKRTITEDSEATLQRLPPTDIRHIYNRVVTLATVCHAIFIAIRLFQAYSSKSQKFFLMFIHFAWSFAFVMICWLHFTLFKCRFDVLAYCNGLIKFFGSYLSMPGSRMSAKWRRKVQQKPSLVHILVVAFIFGAVMNTLVTAQIFVLNKQSFQFMYSVIPSCWKEEFPAIIILCGIYEAAMPGINWTLLLFFIIIHLVHLLCTRDYLIMLRMSTQRGFLNLSELRHHYRSIQILHNHYNDSIASFMPLEMFIVVSLTYAGNIGTIRMLHSTDHGSISIPELAILPMMSLLTVAFQIIFYQRAGDLHHYSSYFQKSAKKGLFRDKSTRMSLRSFPPLCVKVGTLLNVQKFTVVRVVGGIVVGTARLSILFFGRK